MKVPCLNCEKRCINCHSECPEYNAFKAVREKINKEKLLKAYVRDYIVNSCQTSKAKSNVV